MGPGDDGSDGCMSSRLLACGQDGRFHLTHQYHLWDWVTAPLVSVISLIRGGLYGGMGEGGRGGGGTYHPDGR